MNKNVMFSSETDQWATPDDFFETLNKEFDFNLDPCADETNHKCEMFFTSAQNGLLQNWGGTEYSAIRLMARKLANGSRNHLKRDTKKILLCAC